MRAGSLRQQHETYAAVPAPAPADLVFGLGDRAGADVVRVLWPSGILQAETGASESGGAPAALKGTIKIEELDRKPSSCPYLFTWNGEPLRVHHRLSRRRRDGLLAGAGHAQHAGS